MSLFTSIKQFLWTLPLYREVHIYFDERKRFFKEAKARFKRGESNHGSYEDYKNAFRNHRVTFSEYMYSYEYWHLDEQERDEFISTSEMQVIYRKLGDQNVREVFHDKVRFLTSYSPFVHRWWSMAKNISFEEFRKKASEFDIISKPVDGTRGEGIFKIEFRKVTDWQMLYDEIVNKNCLLEQCIQEYDELSSFHPASLNTIRVVTISDEYRCELFGAIFRMGAHGSVIDNTHAGGIYAPINVETGIIEVPAIDSHNRHYDFHPDTGRPIKGFRIPQWERIVETCKEASRIIPSIHFAGWDLCINSVGQVEIIEGNHAPDFDGGMQAPFKIGVKKRLQNTVMNIMGIDPLSYISIWK